MRVPFVHFSLLALVFASPTPEQTGQGGSPAAGSLGTRCKKRIDTYDDVTPNPVLPDVNQITNPYHNLVYNGFLLAKPNKLASYTPSSGANVAGSDLTTTLVSAIGENGENISLNPFGTISAGPGISSFDLETFKLACVVALDQTVVVLGQACVISVFGYYTDGRQAPVQTFSYARTQLVQQPMLLARLPDSYKRMKNVTVGIASSETFPALTAIALDDTTHCDNS